MKYKHGYDIVTGFNLPTKQKPKPNKVIYTRPTRVRGILISKGK